MIGRLLRVGATAGAAALTCAACLLLPDLVGSTWTDVAAQLGRIGLLAIAAIAVLWIGGLVCYAVAMVASMPGLTVRQALALNLAGSSAANLLPFGGVLGTGINLAMITSWRLPVRGFASSVAVLNLLNVLGKVILPVAGGLVVAYDLGPDSPLGSKALWFGLGLAAVILVGLVVIARVGLARRMDRVIAAGRRLVRRPHAGPGAGPVERLRADVVVLVQQSWRSLVGGMGGYLLFQFVLFALCLRLAGVDDTVGLGAVFAAFAAERAVTLAIVTPAGAGLAELSAAGLLVALGASPAAAAAGVLLYRLFVFAAEIPVGAAVLAGWAARRRSLRPAG